MKPQPFFKGLSWLIFLNLLVKPVWIFAIDRQVQNSLGHEAYGKYFAVLNFTIILSFLADAGLTNMVNQRIAQGTPLNVRRLLRIKLLLLLAYMLLCLLASVLAGTGAMEIVLYAAAIQALASLFVFLRGIITANQLFQTDALLSILDKLGVIILCGVFIYLPYLFGGISLQRFLLVQVACLAAAAAAAFLVIYRKRLLPHDALVEEVLPMLKAMLPFTLILLLMALHYRLDGFLLERLHPNGAYEAGVYAASYRLLDAANVVGYLASSFLVPFVARNAQDPHRSGQALLYVRHGLMAAAVLAVCFCLVFAPWVMQLLYHTSDPYHADVLRWCIASLPGYMLVHVYGSALTATRRFKSFLSILLLCACLNAAANIYFLPKYGALAACVAALVSQGLCGLLCFFAAAKQLRTGYHWRSLALYLACGAVVLAALHAWKAALLNVWIILALVVLAVLLFLFTQMDRLKKIFLSLR
jgi:O-antigen/teichoic acid export membrane protein